MAKAKLSKKTIRRLAKLGVEAGQVIVVEAAPQVIRPPKQVRRLAKAFGIKL